MSQTPPAAASASSPGVLNGTYFTGTPSRVATSRARSGATPSGSPAGLFPVTSRKFERLIAARNTPVGASSEITSGDMGKLAPINGGGEAHRLYSDDLEEIFDLDRQRPEAVDQFGGKRLDGAVVFDFGKPAIERQ